MAILVIHTGGTIGMVQTDDGFAPRKGVVEAQIEEFQSEGKVSAKVDIHLLEPLIDSANAGPLDWSRVAQVIFDHHDAYDGFVVTHGTDTLAYTAAALCFALEGLAKPVIVTGAMLPLSVKGSDGGRNLLDSLLAAETTPKGVWVQFAGQLMHGARTRKSHSTEFDAFRVNEGGEEPVQAGDTLINHGSTFEVARRLAVANGGSLRVMTLGPEPGLVLRLPRAATRRREVAS